MYMKTLSMLARDSETPVIADCDTLDFWFKGEEATGATNLVDAVGGMLIPSTITRLGNGFGISTNSESNATISGASPPSLASKNFVLVAAAKMTGTDLLTIGNTLGVRIQIGVSGGFGDHVEDDSNQDYTVTGITSGVEESHIVTFEEAVELASHAGTFTQTNTDSLTVPDVDTITTITSEATMDASELYGFALFSFSGAFPIDLISSCLWMADQWRLGNKVLHPNCAKWI